MNTELHISNRRVATDAPAFVVAEIGVNHDGSEATAMRLVEAAFLGGADAVKLQLFKAGRLMHPSAKLAAYQRAAGATDPAEMLRAYELGDAAVTRIVTAVVAAGMVPLATPFSPEDMADLAAAGMGAVKLASPDLVNPLLIDAAVALGLPILLSTGAATLDEVDWAVMRLRLASADFALLHCVSAYPTPTHAAQIGCVAALAARYGCVAGYSDHTQDLGGGAVAVTAGARVVEKHLTHDRNAVGPDHSASADPRQFREYVARIRAAELMLGDGRKRLQDVEQDVRRVSRQSLVLRRTLAAGETLRREDLTCQRPGTGIPARQIDDVIGRVARRGIPAGAMLDWFDLDAPSSARAA